MVSFVEASKRSVEAVVHVKTQSTRQASNPILEFFYGESYRDTQPVVGFGSGVITSYSIHYTKLYEAHCKSNIPASGYCQAIGGSCVVPL